MLGLSGNPVIGQCDKCGTLRSYLHELRPGFWICKANACWQEEVEREDRRHEAQAEAVEQYVRLVAGTEFGERLPTTGFVLVDRSDSQAYAFGVDEGQLTMSTSALAGRAEPVLRDIEDGSFWRVFVSGGVLGIESVDDQDAETFGMVLEDASTGDVWRVFVDAGNVGIKQRSVP